MKRLLIAFCAACCAGIAFLGWRLAGEWISSAPDTLDAVPAIRSIRGELDVKPAATGKSSQASDSEAAVATPADASQSPQNHVTWAGNAAANASQRELQRADLALAIDPDNIGALRDKAAALAEMGAWDAASDALARIVSLAPDSIEDRVRYAEALGRLSLWTQAAAQFSIIAQAAPQDAKAWHNLAVAHQKLGRLADARAAWSRVIQLAPDDPDALGSRGEVLSDLQDWPAAAADFEAVLRLAPQAAEATFNLSLAYLKLGREAQARLCLEKLLERQPRMVPAINRMAELCWLAYHADETNLAERQAAAAWCRRSLEIDPRQPVITALLERATAQP